KANDLFAYPDTVSFEKMAFTEPLACVLNSINQTTIEFGDDVLIIGGGTMGLLHVLAARQKGARIILSEPMAERREKALALGCSAVIDPLKEDALKKIRELTGGRGANVVFNTTALPAIARDAVEMTAPGGICVMFSSLHPNEPIPVDMGKIHSYQKTITGAVSPTTKSYLQSVQMITHGLLDPTVLTEAIYDYTDFEEAIKRAERPDSYKVLLQFGVD
ncbi:MAG: zinc-binding dehydrogenase, partial [Eubacterium sp.]